MLTFQVETYDGGCYQLPMLLRWDLELTGGVPCDSLSVTCLYDKGMAGVLRGIHPVMVLLWFIDGFPTRSRYWEGKA